MTERTNTRRRLRMALTAALAALALSGCAATHVGESWQCPLAQGSKCTGVAAADPAVKDAADAGSAVRPAPLYRPHEPARPADGDGEAARDCSGTCNPLAWLARLFDGGAPDDVDGGPEAAAVGGAVTEGPAAATAPDAEPDAAAAGQPASRSTSPADAAGDGLRAPETIGRIWIAPWVDADGVYREGSYVRIVIAPAGWRRP